MYLGAIFQSGAVLQRDTYIPVYGCGQAESFVKVEFAGQEAYCRSSREGNFLLYLPPMPAGGPFELKVSIPESGEEIICRDILIGEVWLCSGQSNMDYRINSDWRRDNSELDPLGRHQERAFYEELKKTDTSKFRFLTIPQCASGCVEESFDAVWHNVDEEHAGDVSAAGGWFGLELLKKLDIPVGLIVSAWGGTRIEAWVETRVLKRDPLLAYMVHNRLISYANEEAYDIQRIGGYNYELLSKYIDPGISEEAREWSSVGFDDSSWALMDIPGSWVINGIAGNGAVWIRKKVELPESWLDQPLILHTGGIDKHDISYCNGVEIGRTGKDLETDHYNVARHYTIPAEVNHRAEMVIAVRGYSFVCDGSFSGTWQLENTVTGEQISLNGPWAVKAEIDYGTVDVIKYAKYGAGNQHTPGILFDGMIKPLGVYALRGVIWYQGESNTQNEERTTEYRNLLHALADCWRRNFDNPEMPLLVVQLPGYGIKKRFDKGLWAYLRESQRMASVEDPNIFLVSAIDAGEEQDIHPQDKKVVGERLAACALNKVYDFSGIVPGGPELLGYTVLEDGRIKLTFAVHGKFRLLENARQSIYIADESGEFTESSAIAVDGDSLIVTPGKSGKPVELRYAWADFPECTIFNDSGYPASSFRLMLED